VRPADGLLDGRRQVSQRRPITRDPPSPAASGERRALARDIGDQLPPPGEARLNGERGRLEIVAVVAYRTAERVPGSVDGGCRHMKARHYEQVETLHMRQSRDHLADTADLCPAPSEAERDIGANTRCDADVTAPRPPEYGGCVGGPTPKPCTSGDPLSQPHPPAPTHGRQGYLHEVATSHTATTRSDNATDSALAGTATLANPGHLVDNLESFTVRDLELVVEVDRDHLRIEQVIPVRPEPCDPQARRELRRC
jgi:hypothetical protein